MKGIGERPPSRNLPYGCSCTARERAVAPFPAAGGAAAGRSTLRQQRTVAGGEAAGLR